MCSFLQLYSGDEGYIVRCSDCMFYQVGFGTSMLTLHETELDELKVMVQYKLGDADMLMHDEIKCVWLPAPSTNHALLLTYKELKAFAYMLEEADTEEKTRALLQCFNK